MDVLNKLKNYRNMSQPVKASFWYTVCNFLQKGMALLATPIFTRLMTQEQYGEYSVFMSWFNILAIGATLNVYQNSYNKGLLLQKQRQNAFSSSQLGLCTTLTTLLLILYLLFPDFWCRMLNMRPALMVPMFLLLYSFPAMEIWSARERFDYRYKKFVVITLATTLLSMLTGVGAVLLSHHKTEARVYTDVLVKAAFGFALYALIMTRGRCFFRWEDWKYGIAFNLPLIPHYLSTFALNQADRLMIDSMVGSAEAAIYSVAFTISTVMVLVTNAINNSLIPYMYKAIHAGEPETIRAHTRPLFFLVTALCIVTMCFTPEVILLFAGTDYAQAIWVVPPIAASVYFIFLYHMFSTVEYYYQKATAITVASCVCAIANLVLNYLFIPVFGYYAAGYTTLVCYIFLAAAHFLFYRRTLRKELPETGDLHDQKTVLLCCGIVLAAMLVMTLTYRYLLLRYGIIAVICAVVFWKRKDLFRKEQ